MNFKSLKNLLVASAALFSAATYAGVITDVEGVNSYLAYDQSVSWTHNLNDEGFTLGSAYAGYIEIELSDDASSFWDGIQVNEFAKIVIEISDFLDDAGMVYAGVDYIGGLGVNTLARLNSDGFLDVTVTSVWGDFIVGNSILTVFTTDAAPTAAVPEPTTLALFGLGLIGLGMARRKAKG